MSPELQAFFDETRTGVDAVLSAWGDRARTLLPGPVGEAIAYALATPGKRFRPALVTAVYRAAGGTGPVTELAAAVEVVHTYSLVHDDLPCMDDDDLRRGRPTTHRRFGERAAIEAGYRMVPLAARVLAAGADQIGLSAEVTGRVGCELFDASGARGMVGGQWLDLEAEGRQVSLDQLREIHGRKTGALIAASAVIGALAARASDRVESAARAFGRELGLAFQIADDVLDATGTSTQLGKTAGKDARHHKPTFATLLGVEPAMEEARRRVAAGVDQLGRGGIHSIMLERLAQFIINRRS